ncbi:(d)CMP kinase [bacterium c-19]|nr:(d)CMP kinase [bacterium c-19]
MKLNIAIDGPSAAGKSTIADLLAKRFHLTHLDTGAMYRCCAYAAITQGIALDDENSLYETIKNADIRFDENKDVYLNNRKVTLEIRQNEISMAASKVSTFAKVREALVAMQREIAEEKGYILDGRDIGTVVLPDADVKIYMVASVEARAKRRFQEYMEKGIDADYDTIYKDIVQRDYQDTHRAASPLKKASDAIEIDTSDMSIKEVVEKVSNIITDICG